MELRVAAADGVELAVEHIPARGVERGAAWLGHAILANRRSLDRPAGGGLASAIAEAGVHAYVVDLRGHGRSGAAPAWSYEDLLRLDFPAVTRLVRERHPGLRLGVVGHSLCGHGAAAWLGTAPQGDDRGVAALVSIAANVWLPSLEPSAVRRAEKAAVLALMLGVATPFGRLPARALRYGSEDASVPFVRGWRRWWCADRWLSPDGVDYLEAIRKVRAPVLAVFGAGDRLLCHPLAGELFHRRLASAPLEIHVAGPEDLGYEPGHMELVTDPRSKPLWRRIARWLADRLGGGGPAAS